MPRPMAIPLLRPQWPGKLGYGRMKRHWTRFVSTLDAKAGEFKVHMYLLIEGCGRNASPLLLCMTLA